MKNVMAAKKIIKNRKAFFEDSCADSKPIGAVQLDFSVKVINKMASGTLEEEPEA